MPTNKINSRILEELQLALIKVPKPLTKPSLFLKPGLGNKAGPKGASVVVEQEYNSIQLTDYILQEKRVSPDLVELRTKA